MEWTPIGEIQFVVFVVLFMMNFVVFVTKIFVVFVVLPMYYLIVL